MRLSKTPLFSTEEIDAIVATLAAAISKDYRTRHPVILLVLKGALVFAADLIRRLNFELTIDYIRAKSYQGTSSSGIVELTAAPDTALAGRHVLLVEDILDTGHTAAALLEWLHAQYPASVSLCTLLDKPSRRTRTISADYIGATIDNAFVVGYGLDHDERFRHLPAIYTVTR